MTCNDVSQLLDPFLDTELPPPMLLAVAKHAASCDACDAMIRELSELRDMVGRENAAAVGALDFGRVWSAVEAGMDRHDAAQARARRIRSLPMWGTMVAMAASVFLWIGSTSEHATPHQPKPQARYTKNEMVRPPSPAWKQNVNATYIDRLKSQRAVDVRREPKGGTTVIWVNHVTEDVGALMRGELGTTLVGVVGGLALLCANADPAHAGSPGPFWVKVMTVRADDSGVCDPRLASLRSRLRRSVGYKSYTLLDKEFRRVPMRTTEAFELPDDRTLLLLPKGMADGRILMQVRLLQGRHRLLDTNVRLLDGGKMVFGLGKDARSGDGALLIVLEAESDLGNDLGND